MKTTFTPVACAFAMALSIPVDARENPSDPHEYIESGLAAWNEPSGGQTFYQEVIGKLGALKSALPASEPALKGKIDAGVAALEKMRDTQDDSDLDDLSSMAAGLAKYHRANRAALDAAPQGALALAYRALDEANPPRFFEEKLIGGGILSGYLSHYLDPRFGVSMPAHATAAMVDALDWVTPQNDGEQAGLNLPLIYTFATLWGQVAPRLEAMDAGQRELVLDELEIALQVEPGAYGPAIKTSAEANLAAARASYPEIP
jgi:hypothetical protein